MKLTDEQMVKLIADAFRVGRNEGMEVGSRDGYENGLRDGHDEGYNEGYGEGWDNGYEAAEKDAEDNAADDDGYDKGYEEGWDKGWAKGYDSGEASAKIAAEEDSDATNGGCYGEGWDKAGEDACKCPQCTNPREYDMGWEDGFNGSGLDLDMGNNIAYMAGYLQGRNDRELGIRVGEEAV